MTGNTFTTWRKATYSHANGDCVEVATRRTVIGVRDTIQHGHGPVLQFSPAAWRAFVDAAKAQHALHFGVFNLPKCAP